jgi:two-component system chemotaxis sensor kinase CheA
MRRVAKLLGGARRDVVEIERSELDALCARALTSPGSIEIVPLLMHWMQDPIEPRLERLAQQAHAVARRLGKPEPKVAIEANGIRLSAAGFSAYWGAMVHVVRNAVDHGIESAERRIACGKPEAGTLVISAQRADGRLTIEVRDDGGGVNWEKVRAKAQAAGLPHATHEQLIEALFTDGLSTKEEASEISGRGVGLAALRATVSDLGGSIEVSSRAGEGSRFAFSFEEQTIARARRKSRESLSSLLPNGA